MDHSNSSLFSVIYIIAHISKPPNYELGRFPGEFMPEAFLIFGTGVVFACMELRSLLLKACFDKLIWNMCLY